MNESPRDEVDRWLNLVSAAADGIGRLTDTEVAEELAEASRVTESTQYRAGRERGKTVRRQMPEGFNLAAWMRDPKNAPEPRDHDDFKAGYLSVIDETVRLIAQVQRMVRESGNPEGFDAAAWVSRWLDTPVPALGGQRPIDLLDTTEGQAKVVTVIAQMQTGAYT